MNTTAVINHIVSWLDDYAKTAATRGFVVGVSGGIDSAVTSTLIAKTGREVTCVEMPIYQAPNQVSRALNHIDFLKANYSNVTSVEVQLTPIFDAFLAAVPAVEDEEKRMLSLANTRARLRMLSLYYFAGLNNDLVAGTGNKVEDFGVGFYTKYGDGGVDLSPIADLNKSEVYALGEALGVSQQIIQAAPTDGLFGDDRTDEDQIGASYPELEWAMDYVESGQKGQISERQQQVLTIYLNLHRANAHKMKPIPVCEIPLSIKNA